MKKNPGKLKKIIMPVCRITLAGAILMLAACGEKPEPAKPPVPKTTPLFQSEREALDKARGVEKTLEKSAEELKREEEKQAQ
ncbi:MAG: hypothetical protein Q8L69_12255 [Gallionellaceae bacterium]|nr:hypothetical protein [Gallionellaceae bacterium]